MTRLCYHAFLSIKCTQSDEPGMIPSMYKKHQVQELLYCYMLVEKRYPDEAPTYQGGTCTSTYSNITILVV